MSVECRSKFSHAKLKEENPNFNTQAGEQTFVWVSRFKHEGVSCSYHRTTEMVGEAEVAALGSSLSARVAVPALLCGSPEGV